MDKSIGEARLIELLEKPEIRDMKAYYQVVVTTHQFAIENGFDNVVKYIEDNIVKKDEESFNKAKEEIQEFKRDFFAKELREKHYTEQEGTECNTE